MGRAEEDDPRLRWLGEGRGDPLAVDRLGPDVARW